MTFNEWVFHFHLDYELLATRCNSDGSKKKSLLFCIFNWFDRWWWPIDSIALWQCVALDDDNCSVQLGTQPTALIGFVWLLIVIVLRRGSQIKQVRKKGAGSSACDGRISRCARSFYKANELFCFVQNDTQKMVRKKRKKKKLRATGAKKGQSSSHWLLLSDCT